MSYDIITSIKIADDKVYVTAASNNVYPRTPYTEEIKSMSAMLQEKGRDALDVYILEAYENGNFQGGKNKYTRALEVLRHLPEYKNYDWRGDWEGTKDARGDDKQGYQKLLLQALKTRLPKEKYVITKNTGNGIAYFYQRKGAGFCKWYYDKARAKMFAFREDAEAQSKYFIHAGSEQWIVEPV